MAAGGQHSDRQYKLTAPVRYQPLLVRFSHFWFRCKRRVFDSPRLAKWTRILRHFAYITFVIQSSLAVGMNRALPWAFWLNLLVIVAFAISSVISESLPKRERRPRVSDVHHVRELEARLRNLIDELQKYSAFPESLTLLGKAYVKQAFRTACFAVCAERDVWVSFMREDDNLTLQVSMFYPGGEEEAIPKRTEIPLAVDPKGYKVPADGTGAAGYAYGLCKTVYVPNVRIRTAYFPEPAISGEISYDWLGTIWKESEGQRQYKSVIAVPVYVRASGERRPFGVLNYENTSVDGFGSADFHVACIAAGLLGQGIAATLEVLGSNRAACLF